MKGICKWTHEKLLVSLPWKTRGHGLRAPGPGYTEPCTVRAADDLLYGGASGRFVTARRSGPILGSAGTGGGTGDGTGTHPQHSVKFCLFPFPLQPRVLWGRSSAPALQHCPKGDQEPVTAPWPGERSSGDGVPAGCWGTRRSLTQPRASQGTRHLPPSHASALNGKDLLPLSSAAHLHPTPPSTCDTAIAGALSPQGLPCCHQMVPDRAGMAGPGTEGAAHIHPSTRPMSSMGAVAGGKAGSSAGAFPGQSLGAAVPPAGCEMQPCAQHCPPANSRRRETRWRGGPGRGAGKSTSRDAQPPGSAADRCQGSERVHEWAQCHPRRRDRGLQPRHGPAGCPWGVCRGRHPIRNPSTRPAHRQSSPLSRADARAGGAARAPSRDAWEGGRGGPRFGPSTRVPTPAAALRATQMLTNWGGRLEHRRAAGVRRASPAPGSKLRSARAPHPPQRVRCCPGTDHGHPEPRVRGDPSGGQRRKARLCWQLARGGGVAVRKTCEGCV